MRTHENLFRITITENTKVICVPQFHRGYYRTDKPIAKSELRLYQLASIVNTSFKRTNPATVDEVLCT